MIQALNDSDKITIDLFGKEKEVKVISTGDNQFDEEGQYKEDGFALNEEEIACLNWFIANVNISSVTQSKDGLVYPEISFYGDCKCAPEYGICIGFRDKKFLGVRGQYWTL